MFCCLLSACNAFQPPDTENPEVTLSGETDRLTTNSDVTLEGNLALDVVKFVYRLNGGDPRDVTASISDGVFKIVLEDLPVGTHTVVFEATDAAGNVTVSEPVTLVIVDLNGVWGSVNGAFKRCERPTINDYVLVLNVQQTGPTVTGTVTAEFSAPYLQGTFSGVVSNENVLEAQVSFPSAVEGIPSATGTLTFKVEADKLTGELSYIDGSTCSENDPTPAPTTINATLTKGVDVPPLPPDDALEQNDTLETATPLATLPYQSPTDFVLIRDDPDWYKVVLTESSVLSLSLGTEQNEAGFILQLYNDNGPVDETRISLIKIPNEVFVYETDWGLAAGVYYLRITGTPYFKQSAMPYTFRLRAVPTPDALLEPNDSADQAYVIETLPFSEEIYLQSGDADWFRFSLQEPPKGQINVLKFSGIVFPGMTLYSTKKDAGGKLVPDKELYKDDDFFFDLQGLAAGSYFLRVQESGSVGAFTLAFALSLEPAAESPSP